MEEKIREVILKIEGGKDDKYTRYELHKIIREDIESYNLYAFDKEGMRWYMGTSSHDYVASRLLSKIKI